MHWRTWLANLPKLSRVVVSRHFKPGNFGEILSSQLHHFADASQMEFRAVAHVRFENADGLFHATFFWQNLV